MSTSELRTTLHALARATEQDFSGATFDSRLRIQKAIYFLKALGYSPAVEYSFGDYFHGPYSSRLADQYYKLRKEDPKRPFTNPTLALPARAINFLREATNAGNDTLEAAATMHAFLARNRGASVADAIVHLRKVKGWLAGRGREALALLEKHRLVPGAT